MAADVSPETADSPRYSFTQWAVFAAREPEAFDEALGVILRLTKLSQGIDPDAEQSGEATHQPSADDAIKNGSAAATENTPVPPQPSDTLTPT